MFSTADTKKQPKLQPPSPGERQYDTRRGAQARHPAPHPGGAGGRPPRARCEQATSQQSKPDAGSLRTRGVLFCSVSLKPRGQCPREESLPLGTLPLGPAFQRHPLLYRSWWKRDLGVLSRTPLLLTRVFTNIPSITIKLSIPGNLFFLIQVF